MLRTAPTCESQQQLEMPYAPQRIHARSYRINQRWQPIRDQKLNSLTSRNFDPTVVRKGSPFLSGLLVYTLNPDYFSSATTSGADVSVEPRLPVPTRV